MKRETKNKHKESRRIPVRSPFKQVPRRSFCYGDTSLESTLAAGVLVRLVCDGKITGLVLATTADTRLGNRKSKITIHLEFVCDHLVNGKRNKAEATSVVLSKV